MPGDALTFSIRFVARSIRAMPLACVTYATVSLASYVKFDAAARDKIKPFLGHKVNISGTIKNGVLTIDSIASVKM